MKLRSPYGTVKFKTIDEYHDSLPASVRAILDQLRKIIGEAAPKATETISYNIPAFKMNKVLVHYAANKKHIGFYPTPSPITIFKNELVKYKTSKGVIQLPMDQPLPITLIKKIVRFRVTEDNEKMK
jgi:uncharacterized protein YdhG (YjbR/CyaY superfamily)